MIIKSNIKFNTLKLKDQKVTFFRDFINQKIFLILIRFKISKILLKILKRPKLLQIMPKLKKVITLIIEPKLIQI